MENHQNDLPNYDKVLDIKAVQRAHEEKPSEYAIASLELFFKVFADTSRLKILFALRSSELCVYDICSVLSLKQSTVSQQLRFLRQMGVVKSRQDGKNVYYSLDDDHIDTIINIGLEHIDEKR